MDTLQLFQRLDQPNSHLPALADARIQDYAASLLRRHSMLALRRIDCEVRQGRLVLSGCLPSYYLKQMAQEAVSSVEGIDELENQIEVIRRR